MFFSLIQVNPSFWFLQSHNVSDAKMSLEFLCLSDVKSFEGNSSWLWGETLLFVQFCCSEFYENVCLFQWNLNSPDLKTSNLSGWWDFCLNICCLIWENAGRPEDRFVCVQLNIFNFLMKYSRVWLRCWHSLSSRDKDSLEGFMMQYCLICRDNDV